MVSSYDNNSGDGLDSHLPTDFVSLMESTKASDVVVESDTVEENYSDMAIDYTDLIAERAFIGDTPFDTIKESLTLQFSDYIEMEDRINYVEIFYNQLNDSYLAADSEDETHPIEVREVLDNIQHQFVDFITNLFQTHLTISITSVESNEIDYDDIAVTIRLLYDYFVLGAKENFKVVIASDIAKYISPELLNDNREYVKKINSLMELYSPLIRTFGAMEFLEYTKKKDIIRLFDEGKVNGNFLRKYSPKLYKNESFQIDLINYITMVQQFGKEIMNNG